MFLTVHAPMGALVGFAAGGPVVAFIGGVLSHFVLDIIPHGDEGMGPECEGTTCSHAEETRFFMRLGVTDGIIMCAMLLLLLEPWRGIPALPILAGIVGGVLPDALQGIAMARPWWTPFVHFRKFHDFFHLRVIPWEAPMPAGMAVQAVVLLAAFVVYKTFGA